MDLLLQLCVNGLVAGGTYAVGALGFSLIYSATRFFNVAHGAVFVVAAYATYALGRMPHLPDVIALSLGIAAAGFFGLLCEIAVFKPLRKRGANDLGLLLASLGIYIAVQNSVQMLFGPETLPLRDTTIVASFSIGSARATVIQAVIFASSLVLCGLIWLCLRFTGLGRAIRAVSENRQLASVMGLPSDRIIAGVFFLGSTLAGVAGILVGYDRDIMPTMGFDLLLMAVIAAIIGGVGSVTGSLLGGFFLGLCEHVGVWVLPSTWQDLVPFALFIIFLLIRPSGFLGRREAMG